MFRPRFDTAFFVSLLVAMEITTMIEWDRFVFHGMWGLVLLAGVCEAFAAAAWAEGAGCRGWHRGKCLPYGSGNNRKADTPSAITLYIYRYRPLG